jgi:hypothetical protein
VRTWADHQDALMRELYPNNPMDVLVQALGKSQSAIYNRAQTLGLKKTAEYLQSEHACRLRRGDNVGAQNRFSKGHPTWNKGMKGWQAEGVQKTQFKPGNKPQTWQPIGTEKLDKDGILLVKVSDDAARYKRWIPVQRLIWERLHGKEVPKGYFVVMRDKSRSNFAPENLELVNRSEHMKRNSYHQNYPKEIQLAIQLRGALNRQINKRMNHEQH